MTRAAVDGIVSVVWLDGSKNPVPDSIHFHWGAKGNNSRTQSGPASGQFPIRQLQHRLPEEEALHRFPVQYCRDLALRSIKESLSAPPKISAGQAVPEMGQP